LPKALEYLNEVDSEDHTTVVLAPLIGALVEEGKSSLALALIENIENRHARAILVAKVVRELMEAHDIEQALRVTERMDYDMPPDALIEVARGFARLGDVDRAIRIAKGIEVKGSKIAAFAEIARVLSSSGKYEEAIAVTRAIKRKKSRDVEQLRIVEEMARNGKIEEAVIVAGDIETSIYRIYAMARVAVALAGHTFEEQISPTI
jgi:tetratricopeptide (TPR) repeat protein